MRMAFELFATGSHTIGSLQAKLTEAGLRMPRTGVAISEQTVQKLLRDKYYIGTVTYKGMEYEGRHPKLVEPELFERVQRVMDAHSGSTRLRNHPHYLKGLLYCGRCQQRYIVQRAKGRQGGLYFYFFCRGRQQGMCNQPYVPVEVMEKAVEQHYGYAVRVSDQFLNDVKASVDEALKADFSLTAEMRDKYTRRLESLDRKEDYYLDLGAEEGWPKDKLRSKIAAIRDERQSIPARARGRYSPPGDRAASLHGSLGAAEQPSEDVPTLRRGRASDLEPSLLHSAVHPGRQGGRP